MPPRVYYLDDETLLIKQFARYMTAQGVDVRVFEDAQLLIEACREAPPDVLFLDYRLADTTGTEVATKVDSGIKKALVTGELSVEPGDQFRAVLKKPFRLGQALDLIHALVAEG